MFKFSLGMIVAFAAIPAMADSRFSIRHMDRYEGPPGRGFCEIRLQVDDTVEVSIDGDQVFMRTLSGQNGRDDGSACNMPLPRRPVAGFNFDVKERRGDINLVEGPSPRNNGRVIVRIHDGPGGFGRYIFQISWDLEGFRQPPPPPPDRGPGPPEGYERRGEEFRDLRIVSARWGVPGRDGDVTRLVQESMRGGRIRIRASNDVMGFDPALNVPKQLFVIYELRGRRQEAHIPEGGFLELP